MGLFDDDTSRKRDEVRIGVSDEEDDSRLRDDVESRVGNDRTDSSGSSVSLEDIHEQNERIIELLEKAVGEKNAGKEIGDPDSISDRRSNRNDTTDDQDEGMRGGMDELL